MATRGSSNNRNLPVFCNPSVLLFQTNVPLAERKNTLTVYNPYEFPVRYKMLSNAREKYTVSDSEGGILPKSKVDIIVRHIDPHDDDRGNHKFRLQIFRTDKREKSELLDAVEYDSRQNAITGFLDIPSVFSSASSSIDAPRSFSLSQSPSGQVEERPQPPIRHRNTAVSMVEMFVGLVAVLVLVMPYSGDSEYQHLAWYLRTSTNQRCVASFVLGLLVFRFLF